LEHLTVYSDSFGFDSSELCEEGIKNTLHPFFSYLPTLQTLNLWDMLGRNKSRRRRIMYFISEWGFI